MPSLSSCRFSRPNNPLEVAGNKVGITFNASRRVIQTSKGHRLVEFLKKRGENTDEFMDVMFRRYFEEARDLSLTPELLEAIEEVGFDKVEASVFLSGKEEEEAVFEKDEEYKMKGVSGVPFFFLGGYKFSGAQPVEVFEEVLGELLEETK
jgi:predicted DsbA family dithiol-disulfide isomerase